MSRHGLYAPGPLAGVATVGLFVAVAAATISEGADPRDWIVAGLSLFLLGFVLSLLFLEFDGGSEEDSRQVPGVEPTTDGERGSPAARLREAIKQTQIARRDAGHDAGVSAALDEAEILLRGARDRQEDLRRCGAATVATGRQEVDDGE